MGVEIGDTGSYCDIDPFRDLAAWITGTVGSLTGAAFVTDGLLTKINTNGEVSEVCPFHFAIDFKESSTVLQPALRILLQA